MKGVEVTGVSSHKSDRCEDSDGLVKIVVDRHILVDIDRYSQGVGLRISVVLRNVDGLHNVVDLRNVPRIWCVLLVLYASLCRVDVVLVPRCRPARLESVIEVLVIHEKSMRWRNYIYF